MPRMMVELLSSVRIKHLMGYGQESQSNNTRVEMLSSNRQQIYLLNLLNLGVFKNDLNSARVFAEEHRELIDELPDIANALVSDFLFSRKKDALLTLAKISAQHFYFYDEYRAEIIARLVDLELMSSEHAYAISSFENLSTKALKPALQKLADAYWLIKEDEKDGFMNMSDDELFKNSLHNLTATEFVPPCFV